MILESLFSSLILHVKLRLGIDTGRSGITPRNSWGRMVLTYNITGRHSNGLCVCVCSTACNHQIQLHNVMLFFIYTKSLINITNLSNIFVLYTFSGKEESSSTQPDESVGKTSWWWFCHLLHPKSIFRSHSSWKSSVTKVKPRTLYL